MLDELHRQTRGQDGFATSFPVGLWIPYNMPVYPGAIRVARHSARVVRANQVEVPKQCDTNPVMFHLLLDLGCPILHQRQWPAFFVGIQLGNDELFSICTHVVHRS